MKNSYRYCHVGDWKSPRLSGACLVIATYDMRSDAYVIDVGDFDDWLYWWVNLTFGAFDPQIVFNDWMERYPDGEDDEAWLIDYVNSSGANVRKINLEDAV
tara:strand:- start:252 stop:554 length:303 start_codon:yes stop_codon:yes gene_type:complete